MCQETDKVIIIDFDQMSLHLQIRIHIVVCGLWFGK